MEIYQILSALLHLSNVEVKDQSGDKCSIKVNITCPRTHVCDCCCEDV